MLRIYRFRTYQTLPAAELKQALDGARECAKAVEKLKGVRTSRIYMHNDEIVFVSEIENYGAADEAFSNGATLTAQAKLLALGFRPVSDEFFLPLEHIQNALTTTEAVQSKG